MLEEDRELEYAGIYRIDGITGEVRLLRDDLKSPNGLAFSPDESILYVVDNGATPNQEIVAFDVVEDGQVLTNKRPFVDYLEGIVDGIKVDTDGNLWCGWGGTDELNGMVVFNHAGKQIGFIKAPERISNLVFGGENRTRIFMTGYEAIYSLAIRAQGAAPQFCEPSTAETHIVTSDTIPMTSVCIAGDDDDNTIDRYELESARRALRLIKGNLGYNQLHALVGEQITEGNATFRDHVKRSGGKQKTGTITLKATGLSAADFTAWMGRAFTRADVLIDAQPEHYLMDASDPRRPHIVEALGDHVVGFYMGGWEKSEVPAGDDDTTDTHISFLALDDDGTVFGSVATVFRETDNGMIAELSRYLAGDQRA